MERATVEPVRGAFPGSRSWVEVGQVLRAHALEGALLIQLYGDDSENLIGAERVLLAGSPGSVEFPVRRVEPAGSVRSGVRVRIRLEAIGSRDAALAWVGARVAIPEAALRQLPEGEYYWRDLLGLRCRGEGTGESLGVVEEIWPTGVNDVLVVRAGERTLLVPALRGVIRRVDRARGEIWIELPEGLLEDGP